MTSTRRLVAKLADPGCTKCKLHRETSQVCQMGFGSTKAGIMVVSKMPNSDTFQDQLEADLAEAGLEPRDLWFSAALRCRNFDDDASPVDVKACRPFLEAEIEVVKPSWILAMGNEALLSTTGHSGITKYRGRVVRKGGPPVFPTISPASVQRNPGQRQAYLAELRLFLAQVLNKKAKVGKPKVLLVDTKAKVRQVASWLKRAKVLAYDVETRGRDEWDPDGVLVSLAGTVELDDGSLRCFAIPLCHPESVWFASWRSVLKFLAPTFEAVPKHVAHNGKFDARWLRHYGIWARVTFDTMLAAHLLDENRQKGLKPQAASRLGVAPWGIDTRDLWNTPIRDVLIYNALDTWYTYFIRLDMLEELRARPRIARVFTKITMPANEIYIGAERRGVWMDRERIATRRTQTEQMVEMIESQLMEHVPPMDEVATTQLGWPLMGKRQKPAEVNFNPSNFARWFLFNYLDLPVLERGKKKPDGSPGDPSMREGVLMELQDQHPVIPLLMKRSNQVKLAQFMASYDELLDANDRIHTTFKLAGTVTGRTSSGKVDEEKVTGRADQRRGINLQQVPRVAFVRGLFGAAAGHVFIEADFSQVELRVAAYLSRDPTMMRLFQAGQDIHAATAASVLGIPQSKVTKDHRKKAKPVNFGFLYSMGAPKFVIYARENYGVTFTLDEAYAVRRAYFDQFPKLVPWHAKQRRLAHQYGYVDSPIGRRRHLPDIHSHDRGVVGEAERQAINSPVQSFGSDMMLLAMQLFDAEVERRGWRGRVHVIGSVHDAGLVEAEAELAGPVMRVLKSCMEAKLLRALERKFGVFVDVPIVADLKIGSHWGDAQELSAAQVASWKGAS